MKHNKELLIKKIADQQAVDYLFFWGHKPAKDNTLTKSCFSQWWQSAFIVDGKLYKTAEHWMMEQKAILFGDDTIASKILSIDNPAEVKNLGRLVSNYDEKIWKENMEQIVVAGNFHKFSQNRNLQTFLLTTNHIILVEASPVDAIWGIGLAADHADIKNPTHWPGLNLLGFALMEVRDKLR